MTSQFCNFFTLKRNRVSRSKSVVLGLRSAMLGGAIALLCGSWMVSTHAAEKSLQTVRFTTAKASVPSKQTASVLGEPVTTNYVAFRDYCKNPINTTEVKTLCLYMIEGGPLDSSLTPDDEPLTSMPSDQADSEFTAQTAPSSAIALYQYNPILYQYDKVTLYPLR